MKKILLIIILTIGCFLRFYRLGDVPHSLDWDEASLGYTAYSLLLQGTDEYGNSWPLSIRSFNDYKPPAYAYLTIPSVAAFGLNEFSVRLPSAFFGTLTIFFVFLLTKEFFRESNLPFASKVPLLTSGLFAISPWHLQFSRAAFEANISLFFVTSGMWALLSYLRTENKKYVYCAVVLLAAAMYSYHAPRLIIPLFLLAIMARYRKKVLKNIKTIGVTAVLGTILVAPLVIVLLRGGVTSRLSSVSVFKPSTEMLRVLEYANEDEQHNRWETVFHNRRVIYVITFIQGYLDHFQPGDMFLNGDPVGRHHAVGMGHFYFIELFFICIGIIILIKNQFSYKFLFFFWEAVAAIPAAISTGTPHAIRSMLFLPLPLIAIAVGILGLFYWLKKIAIRSKLPSNIAVVLIIGCITLAYTANFIYYLNQYYIHSDIEYADQWQYGYRELIQRLALLESKYDKIIITNAYDQPYIYFLFYKHYDPRKWINPGNFNQGFDKYEFRPIKWEEDRKLPNTLLVGSYKQIPQNEPGTIDTIRFPNGKLDAFRLYDDLKY